MVAMKMFIYFVVVLAMIWNSDARRSRRDTDVVDTDFVDAEICGSMIELGVEFVEVTIDLPWGVSNITDPCLVTIILSTYDPSTVQRKFLTAPTNLIPSNGVCTKSIGISSDSISAEVCISDLSQQSNSFYAIDGPQFEINLPRLNDNELMQITQLSFMVKIFDCGVEEVSGDIEGFGYDLQFPKSDSGMTYPDNVFCSWVLPRCRQLQVSYTDIEYTQDCVEDKVTFLAEYTELDSLCGFHDSSNQMMNYTSESGGFSVEFRSGTARGINGGGFHAYCVEELECSDDHENANVEQVAP